MHKHILFIAVAIIFTTAAYAQKVTTDFDPTANFSQYKTYIWGEGTPATIPMVDLRISTGVDAQLAAKGLTKAVSAETADLVVAYHAAVTMDAEINTYKTGSAPANYGWWPISTGASHTNMNTIRQGHLLVDIADVKMKKHIWRGKASDAVSENPEKTVKTVDRVLSKMFKNFPPKGK